MHSAKILFSAALTLVLLPLSVLALDSNTPRVSSTVTTKIEGPKSHEPELQALTRAIGQLQQATPALRSHLCYQAALGYGQIERAKAASEFRQCFRYTLKIDDKDRNLRAGLQFRILDALFSIDPAGAEELLPGAEATAKSNIQSRMLDRLTSERDYDKAIARIVELSYAPDFPYPAAAKLMLELPPNRDQDRRTVFAAALSSYRLQDPATDPKLEDFATLTVRFWRHLPPQLVLQGIDEILDHAKKDLKSQNAPSLTIGTSLGEAQFSTGYLFRLFELLPVIEQVDPGRASSLLNDNINLAAVLKNYPLGLQSLEPTYRDTPLNSDESPKFSITYRLPGNGNGAGSSADLLRERFTREAGEIVSGWSDDPQGALRKAVELPDIGVERTGRSPKADALARIAAMSVKRRRDIADEALNELKKATTNYSPLTQGFYFVIAAGIYYRMDDQQAAGELLDKAMQIGSKLYEVDTNHDHPNQAFKFDWPSAGLWRACVLLQDRIQPLKTNSLLTGIKDAEIRTEIQITLANTHLGLPVPDNTVRQQFGDGPGSTQSLPIPH